VGVRARGGIVVGIYHSSDPEAHRASIYVRVSPACVITPIALPPV
jgi:hypothetical protein